MRQKLLNHNPTIIIFPSYNLLDSSGLRDLKCVISWAYILYSSMDVYLCVYVCVSQPRAVRHRMGSSGIYAKTSSGVCVGVYVCVEGERQKESESKRGCM